MFTLFFAQAYLTKFMSEVFWEKEMIWNGKMDFFTNNCFMAKCKVWGPKSNLWLKLKKSNILLYSGTRNDASKEESKEWPGKANPNAVNGKQNVFIQYKMFSMTLELGSICLLKHQCVRFYLFMLNYYFNYWLFFSESRTDAVCRTDCFMGNPQ